jgi:methylmalonyl-CoA mutase
VEFFAEVLDLLKKHGATDIGLFGGGGGTISEADARAMQRKGVDKIFFAGTPLSRMVDFVQHAYGSGRGKSAGKSAPVRASKADAWSDRKLARLLTLAGAGGRGSASELAVGSQSQPGQRRIGITGPGGAGKTTLIDELALRFLKASPRGRLAILSHDPSLISAGALLGDRAAMIYAQHERVFMRSLGTRSRAGGLAPATERCLAVLKQCPFELILVETAGTGQEAMPFARELVDKAVLVMSPDYGSRLQLQKIVMLDVADIVVVNKADRPGAKTAAAEIEERLGFNNRAQKLLCTMAKKHRDPGVDELFGQLIS